MIAAWFCIWHDRCNLLTRNITPTKLIPWIYLYWRHLLLADPECHGRCFTTLGELSKWVRGNLFSRMELVPWFYGTLCARSYSRYINNITRLCGAGFEFGKQCRIKLVIVHLLFIKFIVSTRIVYRGVSCSANDYPSGVWCLELPTRSLMLVHPLEI